MQAATLCGIMVVMDQGRGENIHELISHRKMPFIDYLLHTD